MIGGEQWPVGSNNPQHLLVRITPTGELDPNFAAGGVMRWNQGTGEGGVRGVAVQPDGRIVAAGSTDFGSRETLARFLPSGQPDPGFGAGGFVTTTVGPAFSSDRPGSDVAVLRDGRIALSGVVATHVRVAVFGPDGTPDPSFDGDDGAIELPLGVPSGRDQGGLLALTRTGAIVVAGADLISQNAEGTLEVVAVPSLAPVADLAAVVAASPNPAPAGPVQYTVRVRNDGPQPATGVHVSFELSQSLTKVTPRSASCHQTSLHVATCTLGTLAAGQEATIATFDTQLTGFEEGLFGTASVTSSSYDPDATDNVVTAEVLIDGGVTS